MARARFSFHDLDFKQYPFRTSVIDDCDDPLAVSG